jgi:hypothetical protein
MKIKKCPKCGATINDENTLIARQRFSRVIYGKMDEKGRLTFWDIDASDVGHNLEAEGEPEVVGCEKCAGR